MTHAEFEYELVEALNMLLEDERASVEMEVALASGATEYAEREALSFMGVEDIRFCEELRDEMEHAGLPVTPQINGIVFQVIGAERYDDRLRAFAQHQRVVAEHARELQESNLDGALRDAIVGIAESHERHVQWTERRAGEFAATRMLEFGSAARGGALAPEEATQAGDPPAEDHASMDGRIDDSSPAGQPREFAEAPTDEASFVRGAQPDEWPVEATPDEPSEFSEPGAFAEAEPAPLTEVAEVVEGVEGVEVAMQTEVAAETTEPKPRARATRGSARAASAAQAGKATKSTARSTKATAKPAAKAKPSATPAPRRTRRTPAEGDSADA